MISRAEKYGIEPQAIDTAWSADDRPSEAETELSKAISLKRMADMMDEDRKPRLELAPEGYIGEQEHRRFVRDTLVRDTAAWEAIADAATYIAGRMPLPKRSKVTA